MKAVERKSLWYHSVFSLLLCAVAIAVIAVRHDLPSLTIAGIVILYVAGNSALHWRRHDFHKETLYEYLLMAAAVTIVLFGAFRN